MGDSCEGVRSLPPQTKHPRYGPEELISVLFTQVYKPRIVYFFQLKFYPTGNHSFRLFHQLETESQGQSTEDLRP